MFEMAQVLSNPLIDAQRFNILKNRYTALFSEPQTAPPLTIRLNNNRHLTRQRGLRGIDLSNTELKLADNVRQDGFPIPIMILGSDLTGAKLKGIKVLEDPLLISETNLQATDWQGAQIGQLSLGRQKSGSTDLTLNPSRWYQAAIGQLEIGPHISPSVIPLSELQPLPSISQNTLTWYVLPGEHILDLSRANLSGRTVNIRYDKSAQPSVNAMASIIVRVDEAQMDEGTQFNVSGPIKIILQGQGTKNRERVFESDASFKIGSMEDLTFNVFS